MAVGGVTNFRLRDLGGGMDIYHSNTDLDDNKSVLLRNAITKGTSIISIPGARYYNRPVDESIYDTDASVGIGNFGDFELRVRAYANPDNTIAQNKLKFDVYKNGELLGTTLEADADVSLSPYKLRFNVIMWKNVNLYCVIHNTTHGLYKDAQAYTINETNGVMTKVALTGLSASPHAGAYIGGRLIMGGFSTSPNTIEISRPSTITNPEYALDFTGVGSVVTVFDSGEVRAIFQNAEVPYVGMSNSIKKISSFTDLGSGNWTANYTNVSSSGVFSQLTVQNCNQDVMFYDGAAIRRLGYEQNILAIKDSAISDLITPYIQQLKTQVNPCSSFCFPLLKFYFSSENSDTNDEAAVYNVIDKSWTFQDIDCSCSSEKIINGVPTNIFCHYRGGSVYASNTTGASDAPLIWLSKSYSFGDNVDYKRFVQFEVNGDATPGAEVSYEIYIDDELLQEGDFEFDDSYSNTIGSTQIGTTPIGSNSASIERSNFQKRIEMWGEGRLLSIKIYTKNLCSVRIQNVSFQYKFINAYPLH